MLQLWLAKIGTQMLAAFENLHSLDSLGPSEFVEIARHSCREKDISLKIGCGVSILNEKLTLKC